MGGETSKEFVHPGVGGEGSREGLMFVPGLQRQVEVADGVWKDSVWCVWETAPSGRSTGV